MPNTSLSSLAAFLDGYVDVITFEMFHVYSTMMTGNLINLAVTLGRGDSIDNLFASLVIISYVCGVLLSYYIMEIYKDNALKSYLIMLPSQYLSLLLLALAPNKNEFYKFYVLPLIVSFGMLNAWGNRAGHMPQMMTGNIQKSTETLFKYVYGITMTKDDKGKSFMTFMTLLCYFAGAVSASFINTIPALSTNTSPRGAILLIFIIITLKLFCSNAYYILFCSKTSNENESGHHRPLEDIALKNTPEEPPSVTIPTSDSGILVAHNENTWDDCEGKLDAREVNKYGLKESVLVSPGKLQEVKYTQI